MKKLLFPLVGLAVLTACPPGDDSDSDTAMDSDTDVVDTDTEVPEFGIGYAWDATGLTVDLLNCDGTGFYFGVAETASALDVGWYGEACDGDNCHQFTGLTGVLTSVDAPPIDFGTETLFDDGSDEDGGDAFDDASADRLTYIVQVIGGEHDTMCFTWGHDTSFYAECTEIVPQ